MREAVDDVQGGRQDYRRGLVDCVYIFDKGLGGEKEMRVEYSWGGGGLFYLYLMTVLNRMFIGLCVFGGWGDGGSSMLCVFSWVIHVVFCVYL